MKQMILLLFVVSSLFAGTSQQDYWASLKINGGYEVQVLDGDEWINAGEIKFTAHYKTCEIPLPVNTEESVHVRLLPSNQNLAHFDLLDLNGQAPVTVKGFSKAETQLLNNSDYDVVNIQGAVEAVFNSVHNNPVLRLRARVDPDEFFGLPVQYPEVNLGKAPQGFNEFAVYQLGSNYGSLKIDGNLNKEDLGKPFFTTMVKPCTGHPSGYTYGWVKDDGKNLYVAIDFTPDNTYDGDADYVSVHIRDNQGIKTFRSSVPEQTWGTPGFTYTPFVPYRHKTYEFEIPLAEIENDGNIDLAFELYGTVATAFPDPYGTIDYLGDNSLGAPHLITEAVETTNSNWPTGTSDYDPGGPTASLIMGLASNAIMSFPNGDETVYFTYDQSSESPDGGAVTPGPSYYDLSTIASITVHITNLSGSVSGTVVLTNSTYGFGSVGAIELVEGLNEFSLAGINPAVRSNVGAIQVMFSGTASSSCSVISVVNGKDVPLPVSLSSFYANPLNDGIELCWQTASEIDITGFYIDRKAADSNMDFERISDLIPSKGNSTTECNYAFIDNTIEPGKAYVYRLTTQNLDGTETHEDQIVARTENTETVPTTPVLSQNYPNPFNPSTTIQYSLPEAMNVKLQVFNTNGTLVRTLADGSMPAGVQTLSWDGTNAAGQQVSSGTYICRMTAGNFVQTLRMQLVR